MPIDTAISCSLCVLLLDLLLKFRMTTFRLSALIVGRATSSKELFNATHIAQLNHSDGVLRAARGADVEERRGELCRRA